MRGHEPLADPAANLVGAGMHEQQVAYLGTCREVVGGAHLIRGHPSCSGCP